jgi:glycolate oxidase
MSTSSAAWGALQAALPSEVVFTDEASRYAASFDNMRYSQLPAVVLRPEDEEQVATILRLANEYRVPVTTRGAGTATTGAATPSQDGWVLDLGTWKELHIDAESMMAYVQPGVTVAELDAAARAEGLFYAPDPGSKKYCTIGGTIACNAGGLRGAKYGVTRDYVYALEGFLPTGEFVRWGLDVRKFVSGYNLRDLWIGSEGTLGVITGAVMKLLPAPATTVTQLAAFPDEHSALDTAHALLRARLVPSILEFLDRQTVACFEREATAQGKLDPWLEPYVGGALLLIETDGSAAEARESADRIEAILRDAGATLTRTDDPVEAEQLWVVRRGCSRAMFALGDTKLNEDIVVPLRAQHDLIDLVAELREETGLATPTFGHAADGNFHVHLMYHRDNPAECEAAKRGVQKLMEAVIEMGGAITGEHGIGRAKSPFLALQHEETELRLMQALKTTFDPNHILNPELWFTPFEIWEHPREDVVLPWDHR